MACDLDGGRDGGLGGGVHDVGVGPPTVPLPVRRAAAWRRRLLDRKTWSGVRFDPGRPGAIALVVVAAVAAVVAAVGVWTARPQVEPVRGLPAVVVDGAPSPGIGGAAGGAGGGAVAGAGAAAGGAAAGAGGAVGAAAGGVVGAEAAGAGAGAGGGGVGGEAALLVVSVSGRVARPGVVRVPNGSRVADALDAAGGARPGVDLSGLNLARRVVDGEQIAVGVPPALDAAGQPPAAAAGAGASGGSAGAASPGAGAPAGKIDLNTATATQLDTLPGVGPVTAQHILDWRTRNGRFARVDQLREIDGIGERRFQQLRGLVTV